MILNNATPHYRKNRRVLFNKVYLHGIFIFTFFLFGYKSFGQTISPFALNNGGGYSSTMEWSLCESVSIANFIASAYSLNTGVLQPMTSMVTAINEYGPAVFGSQITIGPNPTSNLLYIKARFNELGSFSFQLIDSKSTIVYTQEVGTLFSIYERKILMGNYPSGVYYMKVYFKPSTGITKTGIYKIIKL